MKIYFYPHSYLRDRQLDTIRYWSSPEQILNPEIIQNRKGAQVSKSKSLAKKQGFSWKQWFPVPNIKLRPKCIPEEAVVYVWGGIIASGRYILDLDNPYALTGYNLRALHLYNYLFRYLLLQPRCLEIRCMSQACRKTLGLILGKKVYERATVRYPIVQKKLTSVLETKAPGCHFLFIGTQFEVKGGAALIRAFQKVYFKEPTARLDIITHLPFEYFSAVESCPGITVHEACFSREEIYTRFMRNADVLVHPTYVESFGMVALEALAHGLGIIATDVYALKELVVNGRNGFLVKPPISIWNDYLPSSYFYNLSEIKESIKTIDTQIFECQLVSAMMVFLEDSNFCLKAKQASLEYFQHFL